MSSSIYEYTKQKLMTHGVCKTANGRLTLTDKALFLKFVRLERAMRLDDFESVRRSVQGIRCYLDRIGKRSVLVFAYMYVRFSVGSPLKGHLDISLEKGRVRKTLDYSRKVTRSERLIADWASDWYDRNSGFFFRALYKENGSSGIGPAS